MGDRELFPWDPGPRGSRDAHSWIQEVMRVVAGVVARRLHRPQDRKAAFDMVIFEILVSISARSCPDPRMSKPFLSWVARQARWRCTDWARKAKRRRRRFVPLEGVAEAKLAAPDAGSRVPRLRGLDLSFVQEWIDDLPVDRWKAEIRLRYFEGLTSKEIGQRLGLPRGTVRADLNHARGELRRRHGQEGRRLLDGESLE